jgi:Tfp pilus assembly protein PilV
VSMSGAPDTTAAASLPPPGTRRGFGTLPSMVISLVFITAAVLAWVAMVPRVREISQPAVDVTSVAVQVRQETGWAISQPQLPAGWKATNARLDLGSDGVQTWHAGYLAPDGQYVSIDQTQASGATNSWTSARTSRGQEQGTLVAAGRTWHKLSSPDILQRSLVRTGSSAHNLTTVLSGTAPYAQLAQFAEALKPVPAS